MGISASDSLLDTLTRIFGFASFRPGQETVCRAVSEGRDVLVVMPTGSGKSLCYQLPAVARKGAALVISPLIALMEDQVAKLNERGLKAERIHSGRGRNNSRAAAADYRDGKLQFLFIAPERLAVPGFPEFLARSKPCLIAVDEAHCVSQWGHDFRPDYRMLQRYLPMLRPAPIIALTATATPIVQDDIAEQLGLERPVRSIQGFRRKNIAIEVIEVAPSARPESVSSILVDSARRPAIVYVPTRKECDLLASDLSKQFRAQPYHAGLTYERRQQVQEKFQRGELEIIVATIAFGMGIDKPDVRTVIHTALPGSTEAYYQEIGRAGRDGEPSRAILMHSYADRHRHDFFFDRDYPEVAVLDGLYEKLEAQPVAKDQLQREARLDPDLFEKTLDKLWIHGGAKIDPEENIARGKANWRDSYLRQVEQRAAQLKLMLRYAAGNQCRMAALVRHFGDRNDRQAWCGMCDFCAPEDCISQHFRELTASENRIAVRVLGALDELKPRATGKLHSELCPAAELTRESFEELLAALARAGLVLLADAVFEREGKQIPYRTARLTVEGEEIDRSEPLTLRVRQSGHKPRRIKRTRAEIEQSSKAKASGPPDAADELLIKALREWRLREAKNKGLPAFRIFSDRVLRNIVEDRPVGQEEFLAVSGIGPSFGNRYGPEILKIVSAFEQSR